MKLKNSLLAAAAMLAASSAYAIPFSNVAGTTPQVAVVAASGGDYTTIALAAAAFSGVAGGINSPWTLEIGSDLTETAFSYFGNSFGTDGSLTIKPAAALPTGQPVVTFNDTTAPAGIFGHVVFGVNTGTAVTTSNTFASTGKYVVDGAKTGNSRDMTWIVPGVSSVNSTIRIWGETNGMVVKNMVMTINDTAGSHASIGLAGGVVAGFPGGDNLTPDNTLIDNCSFTANGTGINGFGIQTTVAGTTAIPAGTAIQGLTVTGCTFSVRQRGIFMNGVGSATISRNNIAIANSGTTTLTNAIFHFSSNGATGYTQVYDRNTIDVTSAINAAGTNGGIGIFVDSGATAGAYTITNNVVKGAWLTNATALDAVARGMSLGSTGSAYTVEHNSVLVTDSSADGTTAGRVAAIAIPSTLTGTASIKNNIIVNAEPANLSAAIFSLTATGVTAANNDIVSPRAIGRIATTDYLLIADWVGTSTVDTTSVSVSPFTSNPAWDANLRFASIPFAIGAVGSAVASTTLTDIDGNARPATGAFPGAQQPVASVENWSMY